MNQKFVSLDFELDTIATAIDAAALLGAALQNDQLNDPAEEQRALRGITATLALVQCRLQLLGRVIRGDVDPRLLLAPHNSSDGVGVGGPVRLRPWSLSMRVEKAKAESGVAAVTKGARKR